MKLRTKVAVLAASATVIGTLGVAYAVWTSEASGTGSAASRTSIDGAISPSDPHSSDSLYPGAVESAFVTITNPNDYPVIVTKIYAGSSRVIGTGETACAADSVRTDEKASATGVAQSDDTTKVIAANGSAEYELVLRMSNDASDNCKSKSFVIGDRVDPTEDLHADIESAAVTEGNDF